MHRAGVPAHGQVPPRLLQAQAEVVVLEVERERVVQSAERVPRVAPDEGARERQERHALASRRPVREPRRRNAEIRPRREQRRQQPAVRSRRPAVGLDEPRSDDTGRRLGLECLHEEVHGGRVEKAVAVQDEQLVLARVPGARVHGRREAAPFRGHDARARRRSLVRAGVGRAVVHDDHLRGARRERCGDAAADEARAVLVRHDRGYARRSRRRDLLDREQVERKSRHAAYDRLRQVGGERPGALRAEADRRLLAAQQRAARGRP